MEGNDAVSKKSDRIKSWLGEKTGKFDILFVILLYIAGVAAYYFFGNFQKRIATYPDELLYYTIAQSIHNGSGILCLNGHAGFSKIIYALFLSPLFGIEDPVFRLSMITLCNSALIMTSLFFVYLIGRELELNRLSMLLTLAVTILWSDLTFSMTFMAESLNWPLTLLAVYLWLKSKNSKRPVVFAVVLGVICYIGYVCKSIFLALFLSTVLFEAAYPMVMFWLNRKSDPDKRLREYFDKRELICCGLSVVVFAVCFFVGNRLLAGAMNSNSSAASDVSNVIAVGIMGFDSIYEFLYLLFAFVYYLAGALIAVMVLPVAYSACSFKRLDTPTQKTFSFLIIYLVISCAMISFTISINEDIGAILPRVHMRYMGFILLLLIVVFFKALQMKSETKSSPKKTLIISLAAAFVACMIFCGLDNSKAVIDQSVLNVYNSAAKILDNYTQNVYFRDFYLIKPASFILFAVITLIIFYYKEKRGSPRAAAGVFSLFMLMLCFQNCRLEINELRERYMTEDNMVANVLALHQYFEKTDEDAQILYICENDVSGEQKTLATYFNYIPNLCQCLDYDLPDLTVDGITVDVPNTEFTTSARSLSISYDKFSGFDYIIIDNGSDTVLRNVTRIDEASGDVFTLYKNNDPATIEIVPYSYIGEPLEITFSEEDGNIENFDCSGIETKGDYCSWTTDDRASIDIPVLGEYESVKVSVEIDETYDNSQQRYIVSHGNDILTEGTMTGKGEISFTLPVDEDNISIGIVCPTAFNNDKGVDGFSNSSTRYAFKLGKITVE